MSESRMKTSTGEAAGAAEGETPASERRSPLRLLGGMIVRPRATMVDLRDHGARTWWLPALLAAVFVVLPVLVAAPITARMTREAVVTAQEQFGEQQDEDMSEEQRAQMEQAMSIAASPLITTVFPAVGGVVSVAAGWAIWAGALYLAGMALGGRSTFGQLFRMVAWAWLPFTLRGLIQTIYIAISGEIIANPGLSGLMRDNPVSGGEMIVAPPSLDQTLLAAFLSKIDLFLIWNLILLVIGMTAITRLPRRKALLGTLGVWILLMALSLVPALVGGLFTQQAGGF